MRGDQRGTGAGKEGGTKREERESEETEMGRAKEQGKCRGS